jgi:hypothetical protein
MSFDDLLIKKGKREPVPSDALRRDIPKEVFLDQQMAKGVSEPQNGSDDKLQEIEPLAIAHNKVKKWAIFSTMLYLVLFPFVFYVALFSAMIFDNSRVTIPLGLSIIAISFLIPLSMPLSIFFIWFHYCRFRHRQALFFCAVPIFTIAAVLVVNALLQMLFLGRIA